MKLPKETASTIKNPNYMCKQSHLLLLVLFLLVTLGLKAAYSQVEYDVVITNGKVLDGSGNPWYRADIAIRNDRIIKIGNLFDYVAHDTIDAQGKFVTPGFIDVHSHAGSGLTDKELSKAKPMLYQGVTTVFINPDGGGPIDVEAQRERLLEKGIGVNVAQMIPHGSLRHKVIGMENRPPKNEELIHMKRLVKKGMQQGAFGLSSGPFYAPGSYAKTSELVELAKIAAKYNGVYTSHIRDESNYSVGLEAAVDEVIQVARKAELPGVVTHIKALGPPVWGLSETIIENIQNARAQGVEVLADQYPYMASATSLISALVPRWAEEGGYEALVKRLEDPGQLEKITEAMELNLARRGGANRIQSRYHPPNPSIEGKTLQQVADNNNKSALDAAIALIKKGNPGIVSFNMSDEDVYNFMRQPWTMTSSDGGLVELGKGVPHPRNYGTFSRKIKKFVLEEQVIGLPSAIRSMTSLPAQVFGMSNRGLIRTGAQADIVIFDIEKLTDKATFKNPHQYSEGIEYVLISGKFAMKKGEITESRLGDVLNNLRM